MPDPEYDLDRLAAEYVQDRDFTADEKIAESEFAESEFAEQSSAGDATTEGEPGRGRRRRRRRRGGRKTAMTARRDEPGDVQDRGESVEDDFANEAPSDAEAEDSESMEISPEVVVPSEPTETNGEARSARGKSRRRRRGGRKKSGRDKPAELEAVASSIDEGQAVEPIAEFESEDEPVLAEAVDESESDADALDSELDDHDDDDAKLGRGHRSIPSWDEAIGFIVAANMESRARNPHSSSSAPRGRGGRGNSRGRGKPPGR